MPYIGKSPVGGGFHKLDALTASATATYALTLNSAAYFPETANQLLVSLNGVIQAPQDSFTVSGSNLIFDTALTASDSIDFVVALGDVLGVGSVTDGAVTANKIGTDAVTTAKIQDGAVTAAKINSLPTGSVLQVVQGVKSDYFTTTSTTWVDIPSLTASITPSSTSSKIMVDFHIGAHTTSAASTIKYRIVRGSTPIGLGVTGQGDQATVGVTVNATRGETASMKYLDSPATTSATTYKIQVELGSGILDINRRSATYSAISTITLTEIAG